MALSSYDELQAAIARTLRRDDLSSDIPDFVTVTEAAMNRRLRVRGMIARASASLSDEYSAVPQGFLGVHSFSLDAPKRALKFVTPDVMDEMAQSGVAGTPEYFTVAGGQFRYWPRPAAAVTGLLTYWRAIPALGAGTPSNWVLASHPDAYLYGALSAAAPFLKSDERLPVWSGLFQAALQGIEASDASESAAAAMAAPSFTTNPF